MTFHPYRLDTWQISLLTLLKNPRSSLNVTCAALKCLYSGLGLPNFIDCDVERLVVGLIKSGTSVPMSRTQAMPVHKFAKMFSEWQDNDCLSLKDLHLKSICLLSLSLMLRPSDIAPKSVFVDKSGQLVQQVFSTDRVIFKGDGSVSLTIMGVKNDTFREGFLIHLPGISDTKLCRVQCLKSYIHRTESIRPANKSVFVSLTKPFCALGVQQIANVLNQSIQLAGLDPKIFTAKYFRCSGATAAVAAGHDPEVIRKLGRWKTPEVFYNHYVHSRTPASLIESTIHDDSH